MFSKSILLLVTASILSSQAICSDEGHTGQPPVRGLGGEPPEMTLAILRFLDAESVFAVSQANRELNTLANDHAISRRLLSPEDVEDLEEIIGEGEVPNVFAEHNERRLAILLQRISSPEIQQLLNQEDPFAIDYFDDSDDSNDSVYPIKGIISRLTCSSQTKICLAAHLDIFLNHDLPLHYQMEIIKTVGKYTPTQISTLANHAAALRRFITPALLTILSQYRPENITALATNATVFFSEGMSPTNQGRTLDALGKNTADQITQIATVFGAIFANVRDEHKHQLLIDLSRFSPTQIQAFAANAHIFFSQHMTAKVRTLILNELHTHSPKQIATITSCCEKLFRPTMNENNRFIILEGLAQHPTPEHIAAITQAISDYDPMLFAPDIYVDQKVKTIRKLLNLTPVQIAAYAHTIIDNQDLLFSPDMNTASRSAIIAALVPLTPQHINMSIRAIMVNANSFFHHSMRHHDRATTIIALMPLTPDQINDIAPLVDIVFEYIKPSNRANVIPYLAQRTPQQILDIINHTEALVTADMNRVTEAAIINALIQVVPEQIAEVATVIREVFTHAPHDKRATIIQYLARHTPEQMNFIVTSAIGHFTDDNTPNDRALILGILACQQPGKVEKTLEELGYRSYDLFHSRYPKKPPSDILLNLVHPDDYYILQHWLNAYRRNIKESDLYGRRY